MDDATQAALDAGLDPSLAPYASRYVQIESGGNPNAQTGSYSGLLQMGPDERAKYGGNGLGSGLSMYADRQNVFKNKFGRLPSPTELYLANQQGLGGIAAHMANPDAPAWQNMYSTAEGQKKGTGWAKKAIWGNVPDDMKPMFPNGVDSVTSQNFMDLWKHKVERTPMTTAFAQNSTAQNNTGNTMADTAPPALSAAYAGGPGAMYGGQPTTPLGMFGGLLRRLGVGSDEEMGRRLQNAGAGLIAVGNPSGAAALQNAANMPLFRQRFGMTSDTLGNKYIFNNKTGQVFNAFGQPIGLPAGAPGAAAQPASRAQTLAQSPVALAAQAKADQEASGKKMEALEDAANQAQSMKDLLTQQALPLSKDPNVVQGAGADARYHLKNWAQTLSLGAYHPAGLEQTADLEKLNQQLVAGNLATQKGVRFAAPEIKFGQSASADLDKPALTNQQIYSNYLQNAERAIAIRDIARKHMSQHGVLGPEFSREVQKYQEDNPVYQSDAVQPSAAAPANRPSLSSFMK